MWREMVRSRVALSACLAVSAVPLVAGCGGDEGSDETVPKAASKYSKADEEPSVYAQRLAKLLETTRSKEDCGQLATLMERSRVRFPCPADNDLRRSMARFEVVDAAAYGNGGVVDYRSGASPDGAAIILIVGPDRSWGISDFGVATKPSVGSSDEGSRADYEDAVATYLRAVRERDCATFTQVAFSAFGSSGKPCPKSFDETERLARILKDNPKATPVYEGGNSAFGFYSFETSNPRGAQTVVVASGDAISTPNTMVMAVSPSPTAEYQRAVIKEVRQQLRERKRGMSPSSKPDD